MIAPSAPPPSGPSPSAPSWPCSSSTSCHPQARTRSPCGRPSPGRPSTSPCRSLSAASLGALRRRRGVEYYTGYLVEKSLSVDNLFVFMLLLAAFAVPRALQQRVLLYGIVGALVLRGSSSPSVRRRSPPSTGSSWSSGWSCSLTGRQAAAGRRPRRRARGRRLRPCAWCGWSAGSCRSPRSTTAPAHRPARRRRRR